MAGVHGTVGSAGVPTKKPIIAYRRSADRKTPVSGLAVRTPAALHDDDAGAQIGTTERLVRDQHQLRYRAGVPARSQIEAFAPATRL